MSIKTLVINPGSTSTKVGVFEDETLLFEETLRHPTEEIAKYASVIDQKDFRKEIILDFLKEKNCDPKTLNVIVGRGGLLKPIPGGTYAVSDALLADLKAGVQGQHAVAGYQNILCGSRGAANAEVLGHRAVVDAVIGDKHRIFFMEA